MSSIAWFPFLGVLLRGVWTCATLVLLCAACCYVLFVLLVLFGICAAHGEAGMPVGAWVPHDELGL